MITSVVVLPNTRRPSVNGEMRTDVGGANMRFDTLRQGLSEYGRCEVWRSPCQRLTTCSVQCTVTGRRRSSDPSWHYSLSYCPDAAEALRRRVSEIGADYVVCSSLNVYKYAIDLASDNNVRVIFDAHNIESRLYEAMAKAGQDHLGFEQTLSDTNVRRIREAEIAAATAAEEIWTCTAEDKDTLGEMLPEVRGRIRIVPDVLEVRSSPPDDVVPDHVVFTGRLDYYPNALAARTLIQDIAPLLPGVPTVVAGAQPLLTLTSKLLPENCTVIADPTSASDLRAKGVLVVPLSLGGGSRFKIIEAFSEGVPVVSTPKGAEGLDAEPGKHYLAANRPEEFRDATMRLLVDEDLRRQLVRNAWGLAQSRHSMSALIESLRPLDRLAEG